MSLEGKSNNGRHAAVRGRTAAPCGSSSNALLCSTLVIAASTIVISIFMIQQSFQLTSFSASSLGDEMNMILRNSLLLSSSSSLPSSSSPQNNDLVSSARIYDGNNNKDGMNNNYTLAFQQSFGFFTDITNKQWQVLQDIHARTFPNHYEATLERYSGTLAAKKDPQAVKAAQIWYAQNFQEEFHCMAAERVPSTSSGDGPKWVCDPYRLRNKPDCLVYSVGSAGKVEFEQGIRDQIGSHCEIHTFDLVKYNKRNGDFAEALQGISTFHHWGLGTPHQARQAALRPNGVVIKTLQQTMDELGHSGRTIDIFKIDCEWCEWTSFREWLQQDIRQLLVEAHTAPMPQAQDFFYTLHDAGYVIFSKEANYYQGGALVEFALLKLHTDFFIRDSMYAKLNQSADTTTTT